MNNISAEHLVSYKKSALLFIAACVFLKGIIAFTMELGGDEAYYWLYSQQLKWNYFDHPPMVALWIRLFTADLLLQNYEGYIRMGSLAGCAISSWFIFKTCAILHSERAGFFGVCLYNVSFYAAISAGLLIMPDSPQMIFYTLCILLIAKISVNENSWLSWMVFGIAAGLCIMSKLHGAFIWIGLGLFILCNKRAWLAKPQLYIALLLTLLVISPVIFWNIQYDFVTYRFHSNRVAINNDSLNIVSFMKEIVKQVFFNNPFNVVAMAAAIVAYAKRNATRLQALTIYNFIGIPLAALLLIISLFRDTILPHWSGPAYVALIPIAAIHLANTGKALLLPKLISAGIISFILLLIVWQTVIYLYPGTYGSKNEFELGKGDITLDKSGRKKAGKEFNIIYKNEVNKGIMPVNAPVVYYKWWAAHIEYYFCRPFGITMIGLGDINNLHEYMWLNYSRKNKVNFSGAYCITPSEDRDDMQKHYSPYYSKIDSVTVIKCFRGNKPSHNFFIYRLTGWKNNLPVEK